MNSVLQFIAIVAICLVGGILYGAVIAQTPLQPMLLGLILNHPWLASPTTYWIAFFIALACAIYLARETET